LVKDGEERVVSTRAEEVKLKWDGWVEKSQADTKQDTKPAK
jgi:hypothetical protein